MVVPAIWCFFHSEFFNNYVRNPTEHFMKAQFKETGFAYFSMALNLKWVQNLHTKFMNGIFDCLETGHFGQIGLEECRLFNDCQDFPWLHSFSILIFSIFKLHTNRKKWIKKLDGRIKIWIALGDVGSPK